MTLTAAQLATLRLEPLAGDLAVTTGWTAPFDPSTATADPDVTIKRTIIPSGTLPDDRLVRVSIRIHFGPQAPSQRHEVTDDLPSGLAPMTRTRSASDEESAGSARLPDLVEGQHVSWCVAPDAKHRDFRLAYSARVVSPGTYRWEPATVQLAVATERITATPPVTITIR